MPDEALIVPVFRREDLLALEFEFVNLALGEDQRLTRVDPGQPAFVIVHFPTQHLAEEAFPIDAQGQGYVSPPPIRMMASNGSRLAFRLPDALESLSFALESLLDWTEWEPSLPPNALPEGTQTGPAPAAPQPTETAVEFPHRLILSPDNTSRWLHRTQPVTRDGRTELWHSRLGIRFTDANGWVVEQDTGRNLRAVWWIAGEQPFLTSLTADHRRQIVQLSANFNIYAKWFGVELSQLPFQLRIFVGELMRSRGVPIHYVPRPIEAERLTLTSLGASARLVSAWDYPTLAPEDAARFGFEMLSLEEYQHIAGLGRDQYVRTVEKGFLCPTGHRASLVTVTERVFSPLLVRTEPQGAVFGATAYLRQYKYIIVQQPEVDYVPLANAYDNQGRENPFQRIRITTLVTPKLDIGIDTTNPFWVRAYQQDFLFQVIAPDADGRPISFDLPMVFVPYPKLGDHNAIWNAYHDNISRRQRPLNNQTVAFAPSGGKPGSTHLKVAFITLEIESPVSPKPLKPPQLPSNYPARFLPYVAAAEVSIPAVEQLLGSNNPVEVALDTLYLSNGLDDPGTNPAQSFVRLTKDLPLQFAAEKAGGLAKPDMGVGGVSRLMGAVGNPASLAAGNFDVNLFSKAPLLGGLTLKNILPGAIAFNPNDFTRPAPTPAELEDPNFVLSAPLLQTRPIFNGGPAPIALETRYLWKPPLGEGFSWGAFKIEMNRNGTRADLLLDALLVRQIGSDDTRFSVDGRLRNFALSFVDTVKVNIGELKFRAEEGKKMEVGAKEVDLIFDGPLRFVNSLRDALPADGFNDPPYVTVDSQGIVAGYTLGLPSIGVGIFSLQNIAISAALSVPFINKPAGVRFALSERHNPFLVTVTIFGGGGFFALAVSAQKLEQIEASIEFGGNVSINLGVASGGVYVMAGIYFSLTGDSTTLTGYLRCGGYLEVLGLISISVEFYLAFTYRHKDNGGDEVWGQAKVTVCVEVVCFSTSVSLSIERRFAGAAGDPTFAETVTEDEWANYMLAFA